MRAKRSVRVRRGKRRFTIAIGAAVLAIAVFGMLTLIACDRSGRNETCDNPGKDMRCWNGTVQICGGDSHWVDLEDCPAAGQQCYTTTDKCGDYTGSIACCN